MGQRLRQRPGAASRIAGTSGTRMNHVMKSPVRGATRSNARSASVTTTAKACNACQVRAAGADIRASVRSMIFLWSENDETERRTNGRTTHGAPQRTARYVRPFASSLNDNFL